MPLKWFQRTHGANYFKLYRSIDSVVCKYDGEIATEPDVFQS